MKCILLVFAVLAGCPDIPGDEPGHPLSEAIACSNIAYAVGIAEMDVCPVPERCSFVGASLHRRATRPGYDLCREAIEDATTCDGLRAIRRLEDEDGACVDFYAAHGVEVVPESPCLAPLP